MAGVEDQIALFDDAGPSKPVGLEELLERALEAIRVHREYNDLRRRRKDVPLDHPIWVKLAVAQETWADLEAFMKGRAK